MNMPRRLYAHGKLMLSGEYLVMHGALSLGLPLKPGQMMSIEPTRSGLIEWHASDTIGEWFEGSYTIAQMEPVHMSDMGVGLRLHKLLLTAKRLNPGFLNDTHGLRIDTQLEFDRSWGLGSSSSLIALMAKFAEVDPMKLHTAISNGSGYDVACALSENPVLFQKRNREILWQTVDFNPKFSGSLYFVFLGKKQNSASEVSLFLKKNPETMKEKVVEISEIGKRMITVKNLDGFIELIRKHEQIISEVLEVKTVKNALFPDFTGSVKSLGAWGGDFILAVSDAGERAVREYFSRKGYNVLFPYDEIVLNQPVIFTPNSVS